MEEKYQKLDHPDVSKILFYPSVHEAVITEGGAITRRYVEVEPGVNLELRLHLTDSNEPHILFFHGNGESAEEYDLVAQGYLRQKINLIVAEYQGYGASNGTPSASSMMHDCHTIFRSVQKWMLENKRVGPLIVMGRSLGSASAIELMRSYPEEIKALIIESGFALTIPVLGVLGLDLEAMELTEEDGFQNVEKIRAIDKPTYIMHGQFDEIIPVVSAEILQAESGARNKQFQMIPGANHNNIIEKAGELYFQTIRQFIDKILNNRPRRRR